MPLNNAHLGCFFASCSKKIMFAFDLGVIYTPFLLQKGSWGVFL